MRYLPHTDADIKTMFNAVGVKDFEDLFRTVPENCRYDGEMNLPEPKTEWDLNSYMSEIRSMMEVTPDHTVLIGAGRYQHHIWYKRAAEQGCAKAQYNLGRMYFEGKGVPQDYEKAYSLWRKAATQGCAQSQYNLGVGFDFGKGIAQDKLEAVRWYHKAAAQGYADAQFNLGVILSGDKGNESLQDYQAAVKWYSAAALQGLPLAQNNLGVMYDNVIDDVRSRAHPLFVVC